MTDSALLGAMPKSTNVFSLSPAMAGPAVGAKNSGSWVRKFFNVVEILVTEKDGTERNTYFDVCAIEVKEGIVCGKVYAHNPKNGTKTLQRHLLSEHRSSEAIQTELSTNKKISRRRGPLPC